MMPRWGSLGSLGWFVAAAQALVAIFGLLWAPSAPAPTAQPGPPVARPGASTPSEAAAAVALQCPPCEEESLGSAAADAWERFRAWSKERGIKVHPALEMTDQGQGGVRGIFAAAPIGENATLVQVPVDSMLTVPGCRRSSSIAAAAWELWHKDIASTSEQSKAILAKMATGMEEEFWRRRVEEWRADDRATLDTLVLSLCLMEESAKGEASDWAPWLAVLPRSFGGAPLVMRPEELAACLNGTGGDVREAAARWRKSNLAEYLLLTREIEAMRRFSYEAFLHYKVLVGSRTHGLRIAAGPHGREEGKALVPFADMFNHNHEGRTANWRPDHASTEFVVTAGAGGIAVGKEVTISYGVESDAELFLFYGFSDASASREAKLNLDADFYRDPLGFEKREALVERSLYRTFMLSSEASLRPRDLELLLQAARVYAAEDEGELAVALAGERRPALERRALELLANSARALRAGSVGAASGPPCASYRERERELFAEVEGFALAVLPDGSTETLKPPLRIEVPPWLQKRVENHTRWYVADGQPSGEVTAGGD